MKTNLFLFWAISRLPHFCSRWRVIGAILLTISLPVNPLKAQVKLWEKFYGGDKQDELTVVIPTSDGGYILGGWSNSGRGGDKSEASKGDWDYWVVKVNADGSKLWDKTYGGKSNEYINSVLPTSDGGYVLGGNSDSGISGDKSEAPSGVWLVKINADGNKVWDKTIEGNQASIINQSSDGGYLLIGSVYSEVTSVDYWIAKVNADGSKVWEKSFGGNDRDVLTAALAAPDGGYLLGGFSTSDNSGDKSEPRRSDCTNQDGEPCYDYWVVKVNAAGTKQWDKTFGGYGNDVLYTLTTTPDGNFLLGGNSSSDKGYDKNDPIRDDKEDEYTSDFWIIKIKANGTKVWDKSYGGNKAENLNSVLATSDGGYLLSGNSNSDRGGEMGIKRGIGNTWVIKIDAVGNKNWDTSLESGGRMVPAADGNVLLTGTNSVALSTYEYDYNYWIVKLEIPAKKVQILSFYPPDGALTDSPYTLSAKVNSNLPVSFKLISGPATQQGNQLRFTTYGIVVVKAFQAGNATYSPVEFTTSFRVQRFPVLPDKTIGGDTVDILADMVATSDGGYLLAGTSSSGISGDKSMASKGLTDYWIVKINAEKKKVWDKSFGGKENETVTTIIPTTDGGYLLGGSSASGKEGDKSDAIKGQIDYWVIKIDAAGNKLWDKSYGGDQDDNLITLLATPDGGYLLGGYSNSGKTGDKSEASRPGASEFKSYDYWLVKIDGQGKKHWDKTLGTALDDRLTTLVAAPEGGYLVGGESGVYLDYLDGNYWVIKINEQGQQLWDKTYERDLHDRLTSIVNTADGGYLLGGHSGHHTFSYWVVKIDGTGNKIWDNGYSGGTLFTCYFCETNNSTLVKILPTPSGNYLLAGYTYSDRGGSRSEKIRGKEDFWLLEINENGKRVADKSFGGNGPDKLTTIVATQNGGYLLGGYSSSSINYEKSENSKGGYDFWLVETQISSFPPSDLAAWNLRFGGSNLDNFTTAFPTNDGGYLLGGYSYSKQTGDKSQRSQGKSDYWVVKTDAAGNKLWDKRYGGSGRDYLNSIVAAPDGGFLLGGNSESGISANKTAANKGKKDMWVVKISSGGNQEWDQSYGGSGNEDLRKIKILPDGSFLLAGYSDSPAGNNKSQASRGGQDYWIIKVNFNGSKMWDKRFGGSGHDYLEDVLELENGDLLLGGTSFSSASGDKSQGSRGSSDYWVVRTDREGKKHWDKRYGGSEQDHLYSLLSPHKDAILLAGQSSSGQGGEKSQLSQGGKDYWVLQVNGKGEKQWDKAYGGRGDETLRSLTQDKKGGYVLGGTSFSGQSGDKSQASRGSSDYWLVKINASGAKQWDKRFGGNSEEELRSVWQTDDGGYLLGGRSNSGISGDKTQTNQGGNDYWLMKVAPEATPSLMAAKQPTLVREELAPKKLLVLTTYPNPFAQELNVSFRVPQTQKVSLKVYDSQGQEITTLFQGEAKAAQEYACKWQAGKSSAGIYILKLQGKDYLSHRKVVLTR